MPLHAAGYTCDRGLVSRSTMPAQSICPEPNLLAAFVDGFVGEAHRGEIERHLDRCADCRLAVVDIARHSEAGPLEPRLVLVAGARIARYRIVDQLGVGGMGQVYRARDEDLDRDVAIKLLRRGPSVDGTAQRRLRREARVMARVSHLNVLPVYDVGVHGGATYIAMQLVAGATLADRITAGLHWREALDILLAAGEGLAAAHRVGVVHRDFKPANVFVADTGEPKVGDFGLAGDDPHTRSSDALLAFDGDTITRTGRAVGTPAYMAPEQHEAQPLDARADVYALCVCLYEALYDRRPFLAKSIHELHAAKRAGPPPPPRAGDVPRSMWPIVRRGLQPDPRDRWPSVDALLATLRRGRRRSTAGIVAGTVGTIAIASMAWIVARDDDPCATERARASAAWDAEQRARVQTGLADAAASPQLVGGALQGLDVFVDAWTQAHADACAGPRAAASSGCLDEALGELETTVDLLAGASEAELPAALSSVAALADPGRCLDADAPAAPGEAPIRLLVGKARVHARTGKFDEALAQCDAASALAREVGTAGLLAEIEVLRGTFLRARGDYDRARDPLRVGYELAVLTGRWRAAADAATALLSAHSSELEDLDGALRWAAMAEAALGEVDDAAARGRLRCALGAAMSEHGRFDEALEHLHAGSELLEGDTLGRAKCRVNIGIVLEKLGRYDEAEREVAAGLEGLEASYGLAHRLVGKVLVVSGNLAMERGELERAREIYERALAIALQTLGEDHEQTANVLENLSNVQPGPDGIETARRALAIRRRLAPSGNLRIARSLEQIAKLELFAGELDAAAAHVEESFAMKERVVGRDHVTLIESHQLLAHVYAHTDRLPLAHEHAGRSTELARLVFPPDSLHLGRALLVEGEMMRGTELMANAVPLVEEAVAIADRHHPSDNGLLADALVVHGLLLHDMHDLPGSIATLERAVVLADGGRPPTLGRPRLLMSLARSLLEGGDRARAATLANQAKAELDGSGREGDDVAREIDRLIAAAAAPR